MSMNSSKLISFIKLLCIVYLVIFIPKIIYDKGKMREAVINQSKYLASIENLLKNKRSFSFLKKYNLALITDLKQAISIEPILTNGFKIRKVFILNDTNKSLNEQFPQIKKNNIPIFQLEITNKNKFAYQFDDVDGIIFNVSNLGNRNDYCFNILLQTMNYAYESHKRVIILDQPNPLSRFIDGPGNIPLQHGLTVAELAKYFNNYILKSPIKFTIIPMIGWQRSDNKEKHSLLHKKNVLNILNEVKPISTDINQDAMLLPKGSLSKWELDYLKKICKKLGFDCTLFSLNKEKRENYNKLFLVLNKDFKNFSSFNSTLTLIRFLKNRKNIKLVYSDSFDKMLGSSDTREFLKNKITFETLKNNIEDSLKDFYSKSKKILLYKPCPLINEVKIIKS